MKQIYSLISLLLASFAITVHSQTPELITDRPDQTESSITVPHKAIQIETGFVMENTGNWKDYAYNTTLVRYGLLENVELRLGMEYLGQNNEVLSINQKGLSPLHTGFKVNVCDEKGWVPEIAFLAGLDLPFAANQQFATSYAAPSMRFSLSHSLDKLSIAYNLGAEWDGSSAVPGYFYSLAIGTSLGGKTSVFVESYGLINGINSSEHLFDFGLTYSITSNFQLDASAGIGLNKYALDNFISFGLTYRIM